MSTEKTFTVVGTAVNVDGTLKVRWANDIVSRTKILTKAGCTNIDLIELPQAMTKLEATQYYLDNRGNLTPEQEEVLSLKISEKSRVAKTVDLRGEAKSAGKGKKVSDPAVAKFIEQESAEQ